MDKKSLRTPIVHLRQLHDQHRLEVKGKAWGKRAVLNILSLKCVQDIQEEISGRPELEGLMVPSPLGALYLQPDVHRSVKQYVRASPEASCLKIHLRVCCILFFCSGLSSILPLQRQTLALGISFRHLFFFVCILILPQGYVY